MQQRNFSPPAERGLSRADARWIAAVAAFGVCACAASESKNRGFVRKIGATTADAAAVAQSSAFEPAPGRAPAQPGEAAPKEEGSAGEKDGSAVSGFNGTVGAGTGRAAVPQSSPDPGSASCEAGSAATEFGRVNAPAGVNVRAKAQVESNRIGGFDENSRLSIWKSAGASPNAWLCVSGQDHLGVVLTGWVSSALVDRVTALSTK